MEWMFHVYLFIAAIGFLFFLGGMMICRSEGDTKGAQEFARVAAAFLIWPLALLWILLKGIWLWLQFLFGFDPESREQRTPISRVLTSPRRKK